MKKPELIGGGLIPTPKDKRDFSLAGVFGTIDPKSIPNEDFFVGDPKIKNQHNSDLCTAFSACLVSEYQEEVELSPEFFFSLIKEIQGSFTTWGGDLRSGCKAAQIGFLEQSQAPFSLDNKERNFIANWKNWPPELRELAKKHAKKSFFLVDGPNDTFDNIRVALWQNKAFKRAIYTGSIWRPGWTYAKGGIIPDKVIAGGVGHAFTIDGQKIIKDVPYLRVPNSGGTQIGDNGFFYIPRAVANREFKFNSYMFIDMEPEIAKELNEQVATGLRYTKKTNNVFWRYIQYLLDMYKKL